MSKIVYDFGMNNGDDVDYYLQKGHVVVAVEANPKLCQDSLLRFSEQVSSGRLKILNVALSTKNQDGEFYIHRTNHVLSQLPKPSPDIASQFDRISLQQRTPSSIIMEYGEPHYIKVDLEGIDHLILSELFLHDIKPDFISAESHSIDVFARLVSADYKAFNLVFGSSVSKTYRDTPISCEDGTTKKYSFKHHSAGPYGEDITSPWLDPNSFFYLLASKKLGWIDIHASKFIEPISTQRTATKLSLKDHLIDLMPSLIRMITSNHKF
jgi:FkbM family methyltransferase